MPWMAGGGGGGRYDGEESAGYRDVALNVRLHTAAALDLGVEMHVCEVQLLLRPFAEIKARALCCTNIYINYRDADNSAPLRKDKLTHRSIF